MQPSNMFWIVILYKPLIVKGIHTFDVQLYATEYNRAWGNAALCTSNLFSLSHFAISRAKL